jgi:hypothetical protein
MAINLTGATDSWRTLVEIALTGKTVYLSNVGFVSDAGTVYEDKLLAVSPLRMFAGSLLSPQVVTANMTITINNAQDPVDSAQISDLLDTYEWANKAVTVKIGQGTDVASDYATVFSGVTKLSGGIVFDDEEMVVQIEDSREKDALPLPTTRFNTTDHPNVEPKSDGKIQPLVYGDFKSTATGAVKVPCHQIDSTVNTGGKFQFNSVASKELEAVYKNGAAATIANTDLTNSTFELAESYTQGTDVVTCHMRGATDDGTSSGTLLENIALICKDILSTHLSIAGGNIDSSAFTTWQGKLSAADDARRVLDTEQSSNAVINSLLSDGFADMVLVAGKYTPLHRIITGLSSLDTFREGDIIGNAAGVKQFTVRRDPDGIYLNQVVADYRYDPIDKEYDKTYEGNNTAEQTAKGSTVRRRLSLSWIYEDNGAETRAQRELYSYGTEVEMVETTLGPRAMQKKATDLVSLVYGKFTEAAATPFFLRDVLLNFGNMTAKVTKAWNALQLTAGTWTATDASTWLLSTTAQRNVNGFWCDTSGYADSSGTPDEASKGYVWI